VKFRRILEALRIQGLQKHFWAHFHHFASKNEAVCREIQTDFGRFLRASFIKKIWAPAFSRFLRPKTELFAVTLRRILEVFALRVELSLFGES